MWIKLQASRKECSAINLERTVTANRGASGLVRIAFPRLAVPLNAVASKYTTPGFASPT